MSWRECGAACRGSKTLAQRWVLCRMAQHQGKRSVVPTPACRVPHAAAGCCANLHARPFLGPTCSMPHQPWRPAAVPAAAVAPARGGGGAILLHSTALAGPAACASAKAVRASGRCRLAALPSLALHLPCAGCRAMPNSCTPGRPAGLRTALSPPRRTDSQSRARSWFWQYMHGLHATLWAAEATGDRNRGWQEWWRMACTACQHVQVGMSTAPELLTACRAVMGAALSAQALTTEVVVHLELMAGTVTEKGWKAVDPVSGAIWS